MSKILLTEHLKIFFSTSTSNQYDRQWNRWKEHHSSQVHLSLWRKLLWFLSKINRIREWNYRSWNTKDHNIFESVDLCLLFFCQNVWMLQYQVLDVFLSLICGPLMIDLLLRIDWACLHILMRLNILSHLWIRLITSLLKEIPLLISLVFYLLLRRNGGWSNHLLDLWLRHPLYLRKCLLRLHSHI
jgi:hypothetical protein